MSFKEYMKSYKIVQKELFVNCNPNWKMQMIYIKMKRKNWIKRKIN